MYVQFIGLMQKCIVTKFFFTYKTLRGHLMHPHLCSAIMEGIQSECFQLPAKQLVGLVGDGASVLISPRNGVITRDLTPHIKFREKRESMFTIFTASLRMLTSFN